MTHALGTTLQDIEAKAERKREALEAAELWITNVNRGQNKLVDYYKTIRKYIEEN